MKNAITAVLILIAVCLAIWVLPQALQDADGAERILSEQGYTEIKITGYRPLMAGEDDTFSTGFEAKSPSGHIVTGAVTGGVFKGRTIRLD